MEFTVVIPARYASTRLPAKALADIAGKPMVVRVAEQAARSGAARVIVATDDARIVRAVEQHGLCARMTRADHASGTDRIAEVADALGLPADAVIVNVQGDEPLIPPALIGELAALLVQQPEVSIATAAHALADVNEMFDPNIVKVVCDCHGLALYFSRAPIPYARDAFAARGLKDARDAFATRDTDTSELPAGLPALRHLGIYAYRVKYLREYAQLAPAPIERFESLEQLRALWHGHRIAVLQWPEAPPPGVDTEADLQRVRRSFSAGV